MKRTKLKTKLMFMALSMVIFVALVSTVVVCMVINNQNRHASNDLLKQSFTIIADDISEIKENLLADSQQMATINDMASKVKYIAGYYRQVAEDVVGTTYQEVVQNIYNIGVIGNLWKAAFYDLEGDLIAFGSFSNKDTFLGYAHRFPQLAFTGTFLKTGEKLHADSWKKIDKPPKEIAQTFDKDIPRQEMVNFQKVGNFLCLVSYIPIMGQVYSEKTEQMETQQVAFLTATKKLDKTVVNKVSRLTGMKINIFTTDGLSTGDIARYRSVQTGAIERVQHNWSLEQEEVILNDIAIQNDTYYQGVLPVYGDFGYAGAIAALYSKDIARANTWQMIKLLTLVSLACVFMIVPITFIFSNLLTKPINRIIKGLNKGSEQVASASEQVSSSSQSLAEGSSEQASSLEETSSSLEEMASMTRQSADNAQQADALSKEGLDNLEHANESMKSLINSMDDTSTASGNVAKIIKTIDEIAFQTNLLALNAAVEAARAGEAGAGFAVVADEVRSLALRTAEASANTQELIEDIIEKIKTGSGLVNETDERYRQVAVSVQKVTELVGEIYAASNQQASGIEQVNRAVAEIDKVTQQTAANAEESASASKDMSAQADQMKKVVDELTALVGESGKAGLIKDQVRVDNGGEKKPGKKIATDINKQVPAHAQTVTRETDNAIT